MEMFNQVIVSIGNLLWNSVLLVLLCGTGIYFTIRLRFVQVRKFGEGMRKLFGGLNLRGKAAGDDGMSSFQALTTAIAAQVGTGNITGCATALAAGGPGAIFWMWLSAFFGMSTIYAEAVLGQKYKTTINGVVTGGPIYYIRAAFKGTFGKVLAALFAIFIIIALGFTGNMVQSNSIGAAFEGAFNIPALYVGIAVAVVAAFIFLGGIRRIASVTEKIVPFMAVLYILGCLIILGINHATLWPAIKSIFVLAFDPQAMAGGVAGITIKEAVRFGVARGLFSNEAGMGSTPHAHALAKVKNPTDQGVIAFIGVFIDTFVILTLTALVIISSGALSTGETGAALAQAAFARGFGSFGAIFIAICTLFFAFSTIVGWYFFGETNWKAYFGAKTVKIYAAIVVLFVVVGSTLHVDVAWNTSDTFNALMVIPNLIGVLALGNVVVKEMKDAEKEEKNKK